MAARISTLSKLYQAIKPHVPMIKFRKGGPNLISTTTHKSQPETVSVSAASRTTAGPARSSSSTEVISRPTIEDYQLPQRYKRLPLDESEINAINSGGAYT